MGAGYQLLDKKNVDILLRKYTLSLPFPNKGFSALPVLQMKGQLPTVLPQ